jgi:signal transduction histidine kinase
MNLILNASDAMKDGGLLKIRGQKNHSYVEISFEDTGHGIAEEHLSRIFDPFFTTKDTGTGLGLSVSYGIIKSFGGDILVESEIEKGTVFRVRVPVYE